MKCPKCSGKIKDGCCIRCGYLSNGNQIKDEYTDKNYELKLFNKDFDSINMNKNLFLIAILGPLYFSYRGYLIIGTILGLIDFILFYYLVLLVSIPIFSSTLMCYLYIFLDRLLYVVVSNYICILIDKFKIKMYKKKYKSNYIEKLKS